MLLGQRRQIAFPLVKETIVDAAARLAGRLHLHDTAAQLSVENLKRLADLSFVERSANRAGGAAQVLQKAIRGVSERVDAFNHPRHGAYLWGKSTCTTGIVLNSQYMNAPQSARQLAAVRCAAMQESVIVGDDQVPSLPGVSMDIGRRVDPLEQIIQERSYLALR
jgi:predicted ATPase